MSARSPEQSRAECNREYFEYFDQSAHVWDRERAHHNDDFTALIRRARIQDGDHVLDLGTGTGTMAIEAAQHTSGHVYGVDITKNMILQARQKTPQALRERVHFLEGEICDMTATDDFDPSGRALEFPHAPNGFNVVLGSWLLHGLSETERAVMFRHLRRYLAPGARIVMDWCSSLTGDGELTAGGAIWDFEHPERCMVKMTWAHDTFKNHCMGELQDVAVKAGLKELEPVQYSLGSDEYEVQIPPKFISDNMAILEDLARPEARVRLPEASRQSMVLLQEMHGAIRSGEVADVAGWLNRRNEAKAAAAVARGETPDPAENEDWMDVVEGVYLPVVAAIHHFKSGLPDHATVDMYAWGKPYQAIGVFSIDA